MYNVALLLCVVGAFLLPFKAKNIEKVAMTTDKPSLVFVEALDRLKNGAGSIKDQRRDINLLGWGLNEGRVHSRDLGQKSDYWLNALRRRVDVRESVSASDRLQLLESKVVETTVPLSKGELEDAENLFNIVSHQIDSQYALEEGLHETRASLWRRMYHIRHKGLNPE